MELTAAQAIWLLPPVLPICVIVAWNDMRAMKIPNWTVGALLVIFAIFGLIAFGPQVWAWRWLHVVVMLVIGMALNAGGAMGAGDAKFIMAAAPFVAFADLTNILLILAVTLLLGWGIHRIVKHSPARRLVPEWESWKTGKRYPMGFPLASALVFYLAWPFLF